MLTAEQLAFRMGFIGASEAPTIVGVSPYRQTVHDVYLAKTEGLITPPTPAMTVGNRLEPVALACLAEEFKINLVPGTTKRHKIFDVGATPDSLVLDESGEVCAVAEAKAPGLHMMGRWGESGDESGVPEETIVQVHIQMFIERVPLAYVVALCGNEPRYYRVPYNEELAGAVVEECQRFWTDHVAARLPPDPDGSSGSASLLRARFPRNMGHMMRAGPEAERLAREYFEATEAEKCAAEQKERAGQALRALIGDADGITGDGWACTWRLEKAGRVAWKDVAEAMRPTPELVAVHRGPPNRRFLMQAKGYGP